MGQAVSLLGEIGPDAGRPLRVQFTQAPGAFFAGFGGPGAGGPAGWVPGQGQPSPSPGSSGGSFADDPNIIDAEVVEDEDDHGPPELHAPR